MRKRNWIGVVAIAGVVGLAAPAYACSIQGTWNMFALAGFGNGDAVFTCRLTISHSGDVIDGPCLVYNTGSPPPNTTFTMGGTLQANSECRLTGTLTTPAFSDLTIRDGLIKGKSGTAIATRTGNDGNINHVRLMQFMR